MVTLAIAIGAVACAPSTLPPPVAFQRMSPPPHELVARRPESVAIYFRSAATPGPISEIGQLEARLNADTSQNPEEAFAALVEAAADRGCDALVWVDVIARLQTGPEQSSPRQNVRVDRADGALYTVDGYRGVCAVYP